MIAAVAAACTAPASTQRSHLGAVLEEDDGADGGVQLAAGRSDGDRAGAVARTEEGVKRREQGDLAGAKQALEEALRLDAGLARAHTEWALTAESLGEEPALIKAHYQLGARLAPEDARAQTLAAAWAARQGDNALALEGYSRAIAADPRSVEAHTRKGDLLVTMGDAQGGIAAYRAALALEARSVPALVGLADAAEKAGALGVAEEALKSLVALAPGTTIYQSRLVAFYRRTGQQQKADAAASELERADPKDPRRLRQLKKKRR